MVVGVASQLYCLAVQARVATIGLACKLDVQLISLPLVSVSLTSCELSAKPTRA